MADTSAQAAAKSDSEDTGSMDLARIFLGLFVAGSIVVGMPLIIPVLGDSSVLRLLLTLIPVGLMVLFMRIGRYRVEQEGSVEIEQVADSLYFMGFMFTLVALLVALLQISFPVDMAAITSQFGIAMCTTLAGLLLKVLLTQFKQVGGVTQRQAQNDLLRSTRRFTRVLDMSSANVEKSVNDAKAKILELAEVSIADIAKYAISAQDSVASHGKSGLELISTQCKSDVEALATQTRLKIDALADQGMSVLEMLNAHSKDTQKQLVEDAEAVSQALAEVAEASVAAANDCATRINENLSGFQSTVKSVESGYSDLASAVEVSVQKHRSAVAPLERFGTFLSDNNDYLSTLQGTMFSVATTSKSLAESVVRLEGAVDTLQGSLVNTARVNSFLHLGEERDKTDVESKEEGTFVDSMMTDGRSTAASDPDRSDNSRTSSTDVDAYLTGNSTNIEPGSGD